ncbi:MAG: hypothetical protein QMD05_10090 [Candidatus Brocadiaceae bacterium]|nr:hypothetical protein [Candidatus Brocadiaceae bacterium]
MVRALTSQEPIPEERIRAMTIADTIPPNTTIQDILSESIENP